VIFRFFKSFQIFQIFCKFSKFRGKTFRVSDPLLLFIYLLLIFHQFIFLGFRLYTYFN
jgi:hypothetical protein